MVKLLKIFKKLSRSFFQNDARNSILCNELRATFGQLGSTQGLSAQTTYWLVSTQLELNKLIYLIIELFERIIHADAKSMLFYDIWKNVSSNYRVSRCRFARLFLRAATSFKIFASLKIIFSFFRKFAIFRLSQIIGYWILGWNSCLKLRFSRLTYKLCFYEIEVFPDYNGPL